MVFHAILKFRVHISERSIISLWSIIWVRGYHQKTHYEAGMYLYLSQSSWLIVLGHDWKHVSCVNNKINEQSAFKITSISDAKYCLVLLLMKVRVNFELIKRNFISHFSIGWKGARDDAAHLVGRLVTSIAQTWRMILLDDEQVENLAVVFRAK